MDTTVGVAKVQPARAPLENTQKSTNVELRRTNYCWTRPELEAANEEAERPKEKQ